MAQVKVLGATNKVLDTLNNVNSYIQKSYEATPDVHNQDSNENFSWPRPGDFIPVRVVSGNGVTGYICDIFENGLSEPPTKQGRVFLANGASTIYVLPEGTVMYAQPIQVQRFGSQQ